MSDTILVKSVEAIYPEWVAKECRIYDGEHEVDKVISRTDMGRTTYIIWWVGGEWRHAIGSDSLNVVWGDATEAQPADAPAVDGASDGYRLQGLAAQIVHAQMVLQDALGYEEVDYNISLTDLAEDIEDLRSALQFVKNQLALIPAPITDTRFATETINSVWATVADALDGRQAATSE